MKIFIFEDTLLKKNDRYTIILSLKLYYKKVKPTKRADTKK